MPTTPTIFARSLADRAHALFPTADRPARVLVCAAVVWCVAAADLRLTLFADAHLPFEEANPVAAAVLAAGPAATTLYKLLLVCIGTGCLLWLRGRRLGEALAWAAMGLHLALAARWGAYFEEVDRWYRVVDPTHLAMM